MALTILTQGKTAIRDQIKALITHVAISDDTAAFSLADTGINPTGGSTSTHVEAAANANVDAATFDASFTLNGSTEFTGKTIQSIGLAKGAAVRQSEGSGGSHTGGGTVGTDTVVRWSANLGVGVQSGDTFTIGVRVAVQDNS